MTGPFRSRLHKALTVGRAWLSESSTCRESAETINFASWQVRTAELDRVVTSATITPQRDRRARNHGQNADEPSPRSRGAH